MAVASRTAILELLTIKAAAELLGVSEQTLRRWDKAGKLRPKRHPMNGYRLYSREAVLALKKQIEAEPEAQR